MNATETQYGVVEYATKAQVLTPSSSTQKTVKPYNLFEFATESESVETYLGNIYEDAAGDKPNNTITKAISELTTAKIEKRADAVVDDANIYEYQYETIPVTGVKRQLGDDIIVPKSILQVDTLTGVANPKEYFLYYLKEREGTNKAGLYEYFDSAWHSVGSGQAIQHVDSLPDGTTVPIYEDHFYLLSRDETVVGRYTLSDTAIANGVTMNSDGITAAGVLVSWAAVNLDWTNYKDDELVTSATGLVFRVQHKDGTIDIIYDRDNVDNELYYSKDGVWYKVHQPERITIQMIDDLEIED